MSVISQFRYSDQIAAIYRRMTERQDTLLTSAFTLAELLVGSRKQADLETEKKIIDFFDSSNVTVLSFGASEAVQYGSIRASTSVSAADAIHLACAAASGVDLFLTNDQAVRKLTVPGIQFIDGIDTTILGPGA